MLFYEFCQNLCQFYDISLMSPNFMIIYDFMLLLQPQEIPHNTKQLSRPNNIGVFK